MFSSLCSEWLWQWREHEFCQYLHDALGSIYWTVPGCLLCRRWLLGDWQHFELFFLKTEWSFNAWHLFFASVQIYTEPVTKLCHQMSCIYCSIKFTARESYRRTRCVCNSCAPASLSLINQFIHGFIFHKYILLYLIKRIEWICWGENNILCRIQGPS